MKTYVHEGKMYRLFDSDKDKEGDSICTGCAFWDEEDECQVDGISEMNCMENTDTGVVGVFKQVED